MRGLNVKSGGSLRLADADGAEARFDVRDEVDLAKGFVEIGFAVVGEGGLETESAGTTEEDGDGWLDIGSADISEGGNSNSAVIVEGVHEIVSADGWLDIS
uniref:Uncharacterized protein n=1 Tax=Spongospora subterranea TaxID=70186 RepID=A0A0H5QWH0_9EUKA|eukprot:CRZ06303.1 hypothetical protein [Spongospora subterranea]